MNHPLRILLVGSPAVDGVEDATGALEELKRRFPGFEARIVADSGPVSRELLTEKEEGYLSVGRIARGIAHDLNNVLTAVFGYTALAKSDLPDGHSALKALAMVERAADQASVATRALLGFGLASVPEKRPLELRSATAEAVRILRRCLPAAAEVAFDEAGPEIWVDADGAQFLHAILSLGLLERDLLSANAELKLAVRVEDDGDGGASIELSARGLEPSAGFASRFAQRSGSPELSVVERIAKEHGGRLEVVRADGAAPRMRIVLPTTRRDETTGAAARSARNEGRGGLVLLAEAHAYLREIVASTLRSAGYEVLAATSGPSLLELYSKQRERVRLIVLAQDLPGKTGLDCLEGIRAGGGDAPAIIVTDSAALRLHARMNPKALCLSKPFETSQLLELAHSLIHGAADRSVP